MDPQLTVFNTVLGGPTAYLWDAGWGLIATFFALSWAGDNMSLALQQKSDKGALLHRTFLACGALAAYTLITNGIWTFFQWTAAGVYPHDALSGLGELMHAASKRFADYSFTAFSGVSALKDGVVLLGALGAFVCALLGVNNAQNLQVIAFNTLFALGPLLIALSVLGLPTLRTWLLATVEISSWTVVQAVIFRTIEARLSYYLKRAAEMPILSVEFLDIYGQLVVLASLPVVVPAIAARLFGMGIGQAVSAVPSLSSTGIAAAMGSFLGTQENKRERHRSNDAAPQQPLVPPQQTPHSSNSRRPGDV